MTALPLKGIRIADFGQIIAVPYTAQMLAWLGAEVILIENEQRLTTRSELNRRRYDQHDDEGSRRSLETL